MYDEKIGLSICDTSGVPSASNGRGADEEVLVVLAVLLVALGVDCSDRGQLGNYSASHR